VEGCAGGAALHSLFVPGNTCMLGLRLADGCGE
jgi:hypothetical protein